jgi:predicted MFS family arabinose efflux permease
MVHRATPEHLRGRVSAVNMLFIQTSNEAGDFRGGSFAAMFGPVTTGVLGAGIAALVLIWSRWQFAPLYQLNRTSDLKPDV